MKPEFATSLPASLTTTDSSKGLRGMVNEKFLLNVTG